MGQKDDVRKTCAETCVESTQSSQISRGPQAAEFVFHASSDRFMKTNDLAVIVRFLDGVCCIYSDFIEEQFIDSKSEGKI